MVHDDDEAVALTPAEEHSSCERANFSLCFEITLCWVDGALLCAVSKETWSSDALDGMMKQSRERACGSQNVAIDPFDCQPLQRRQDKPETSRAAAEQYPTTLLYREHQDDVFRGDVCLEVLCDDVQRRKTNP